MASSPRLPPLSAVRAFEAAARLGSFTRAAEELAMTQAAVSYQIKLLEERVGAPLFLRRPRQVVLTDTGLRLTVSNRMTDFAREDVDAGVRSGKGPWPGLEAHRLFAVRFTPVCSPDLLRRFGGVRPPGGALRRPPLTPREPSSGA